MFLTKISIVSSDIKSMTSSQYFKDRILFKKKEIN